MRHRKQLILSRCTALWTLLGWHCGCQVRLPDDQIVGENAEKCTILLEEELRSVRIAQRQAVRRLAYEVDITEPLFTAECQRSAEFQILAEMAAIILNDILILIMIISN